MMVCAHGNVAEFCEKHDMVICEIWDGSLSDYRGICRVLVTDSDISEKEYYFLKGELMARGIELVSTRYKDDRLLSEYLMYAAGRKKRRGRQSVIDESVKKRICELRAAGLSLQAIRDTEGICNPLGEKLSRSTILMITRSKKEDE